MGGGKGGEKKKIKIDCVIPKEPLLSFFACEDCLLQIMRLSHHISFSPTVAVGAGKVG